MEYYLAIIKNELSSCEETHKNPNYVLMSDRNKTLKGSLYSAVPTIGRFRKGLPGEIVQGEGEHHVRGALTFRW